jgi:hypothetical protein
MRGERSATEGGEKVRGSEAAQMVLLAVIALILIALVLFVLGQLEVIVPPWA